MTARGRTLAILTVFPGAGAGLIGLGVALAWPALQGALRGTTAPAVVTAMIKQSPAHTELIAALTRSATLRYADGTLISAVWRTGTVAWCAEDSAAARPLLRELLAADAEGCLRAAQRALREDLPTRAVRAECVETALVLTPHKTCTNACTIITTLRVDEHGSNTLVRCVQGTEECRAAHDFILKERSYLVEFRPVLSFVTRGAARCVAADIARRHTPPVGYGMYDRAQVIYSHNEARIVVMPDWAALRHGSLLASLTRMIEAAGAVWIGPFLLIMPGIVVLLGSMMFISLDIWPGRRMPTQRKE